MTEIKMKKSISITYSKILTILFIFILVFLVHGKSFAQDAIQGEQAVKKYGWGFHNFSDTLFSWDIYCHSFFGVPSNESTAWITDVYDKAFYELAIKTSLPAGHMSGGGIVGGGNCFGMSLLSALMNKYGGYYGFCAPPQQYGSSVNTFGWPTYPGLKRAINIMHGHQLGLASLQTFIDQLHSGHSTDASYGITLVMQELGKEGVCLVSINKGVLTSEGHVLIAYNVTDEGSGKYKIWIIDPNRYWPVDSSYYKGANNYVQIDGSTWSFLMQYSKSPWPTADDADTLQPLIPGSLVIFPISVVGPTQRTPSSMGVSVLGLLAQICIWGNSLSYDIEEPVNNEFQRVVFNNTQEIQKPIFKIPESINVVYQVGNIVINKHSEVLERSGK